MQISFSHRNGETEPPTIESDDGQWFWYDGSDTDNFEWFGMFWVCGNYALDTRTKQVPLAELSGRWWGPVMPPWDN